MIAVIDYKAGNIASVMKAIVSLGGEAFVTDDPRTVRTAGRIVLPGVGHFAATQALTDRGLTDAVREAVARGVPFLGICVGLQWLFDGSTEANETTGLGAFAGMCERFPAGTKVPHVGWNSVEVDPESRLMKSVGNGSFFYFTHSYRAPVINETVAVTNYHGPFTSAAERNNVMGVQFHPEKSGASGMRVLRNFLEMQC